MDYPLFMPDKTRLGDRAAAKMFAWLACILNQKLPAWIDAEGIPGYIDTNFVIDGNTLTINIDGDDYVIAVQPADAEPGEPGEPPVAYSATCFVKISDATVGALKGSVKLAGGGSFGSEVDVVDEGNGCVTVNDVYPAIDWGSDVYHIASAYSRLSSGAP